MIFPKSNQWIDIHTHRKALQSNDWVLRNAFHFPVQMELISYAVSVGIHPWWSGKVLPNKALFQQMQHPKVCAIGEIGLDRRCNVPLQTQLKCFETQLEWASELQKPVIIHAVKTYADLLPFMKKYPLTWILHGFHGNVETVKQFQKYNVYFSLGTHFESNKIPLDRLMIETDNQAVAIKNQYEKVSQAYQISLETLQAQIFYNFNQIFKT